MIYSGDGPITKSPPTFTEHQSEGSHFTNPSAAEESRQQRSHIGTQGKSTETRLGRPGQEFLLGVPEFER